MDEPGHNLPQGDITLLGKYGVEPANVSQGFFLKPSQDSTGRRGYFGKRGSLTESSQR